MKRKKPIVELLFSLLIMIVLFEGCASLAMREEEEKDTKTKKGAYRAGLGYVTLGISELFIDDYSLETTISPDFDSRTGNYKGVAILAQNPNNNADNLIANSFIVYFKKFPKIGGKIEVLERAQVSLLMQERNMEMGGVTESNFSQFKKIGTISAVITCSGMLEKKNQFVTFKFIDIDTSKIIASGSFSCQEGKGYPANRIVKMMIENINKKFRQIKKGG